MNKELTGKMIKDARIAKGYTQSELGELVCVSNKAVSRWENGEAFPDVSVLERLSKVLDLEIREIVTGETDNSEEIKKEKKQHKKELWGHIVSGVWYATLLLATLKISGGFGRESIPFSTYILVMTLILFSISFSIIQKKAFAAVSTDRSFKIILYFSSAVCVAAVLNCAISIAMVINGATPFRMDISNIGPYMNAPLIAVFAMNLLIISLDFFLVEFKGKIWNGFDFLYVFYMFLAIVFTDGLHGNISATDFFPHILREMGIVILETGAFLVVCLVLKNRTEAHNKRSQQKGPHYE